MKRTKKLSLGMKIASILACLALVSVGFASWWIIKFPQPTQATDGQFTVYTVDTKSIHFSNVTWGAEGTDADSGVVFGHPDSNTAVKWLGYEGIDPQDLTATLSFTLSVYNGEEVDNSKLDSDAVLKNYLDEISLVFDPQGANFDSAIGNGIAAPKISYSLDGGAHWSTPGIYGKDSYTLTINADTQIGDFADAFTGATQTVMVKFDFGWEYNTKADGVQTVNPYDYYNAKNYETALANEASGILSTVAGIGTTTYTVNISTTPTGSAN